MTSIRLSIGAAAIALCSSVTAIAAPAYVKSTVHLRAGAGTNHEIVAKIPGGSLVDATNCAEGWCEVEWQEKKGFSIATALDRSGRVPTQSRSSRAYGPDDDDEIVVRRRYIGPRPYYGPAPFYYGPRPYWGGPYWRYRRWGW